MRTSLRLDNSNPKTTLGTYEHLLPNSDHDVEDIFHNAIQNKNKEKSTFQLRRVLPQTLDT